MHDQVRLIVAAGYFAVIERDSPGLAVFLAQDDDARISRQRGQFPLRHPHLALVCGLTVTTPEFGAEHDLQFVLLTPDGKPLSNATAKVLANGPPDGRDDVRLFYRIEGSGPDTVVVVHGGPGAGMDAEFVRNRLFRPFDSTKGSKGMGIGAYQVREYIRLLGGDVEVQSSPGRGTRFAVSLPLSGQSMDAPAAAGNAVAG